jgi:Zn-finger nucleic acid-binding protein
MTGSTTLICPECRGKMRTYERNGVMVDQCDECRGIFLDRGELEQLLDAAQGSGHTSDHRDDRHDDHHHDRDDDERGRGRRRSRTSLITDFLGGGE